MSGEPCQNQTTIPDPYALTPKTSWTTWLDEIGRSLRAKLESDTVT